VSLDWVKLSVRPWEIVIVLYELVWKVIEDSYFQIIRNLSLCSELSGECVKTFHDLDSFSLKRPL
jgi:hypothetical protein